MLINAAFWNNKRVFVTGHTGFKGSWLCIWLSMLGARVTGYALAPPTKPSLFEMAKVYELVEHFECDIRDFNTLKTAVENADPQIIFHMAAQPLVREAYIRPLYTYETNVIGTANLLEAARTCENLQAVVVVTSDKCYENQESGRPFLESDPLGGYDPYSSSKACAEIVAASYRNSFYNGGVCAAIATARAGNVIGGGDFAKDRIVPDIIYAWESGKAVALRNPSAIRPWQDVLEPLGGYLLLAQKLCEDKQWYSQAYNFGPDLKNCREVVELASMLCERLHIDWMCDSSTQPHEAGFLSLDNSKAKKKLGWKPVFTLEETIDYIVKFATVTHKKNYIRSLCEHHISLYAGMDSYLNG